METTTTPVLSEVTKKWEELSELEVSMVIASHQAGAQTAGVPAKELKNMGRLFELGRPRIVFGPGPKDFSYCRIHKESVSGMRVIMNEYLHA
jgi:hypothetical protein